MRLLINRLSRSHKLRHLVEGSSAARDLMERYIAGETLDDVLPVVGDLIWKGLDVSVVPLAEEPVDQIATSRMVAEYLALLDEVVGAGLAAGAEISLRPIAIGLQLGEDGAALALNNARQICRAARNAGVRVSLDTQGYDTIEDTMALLDHLRDDFPDTGVAVQAMLHRSLADCVELAAVGARVRLCKGAHRVPEAHAYQSRRDIDLSFVRCLKVLMEADCYPMVATHDGRLIEIAQYLAKVNTRGCDEWEFQMLHGIRPLEQRRLVDIGYRTRVYLPYGRGWYRYGLSRLAERPANMALFARSLVERR